MLEMLELFDCLKEDTNKYEELCDKTKHWNSDVI